MSWAILFLIGVAVGFLLNELTRLRG